MTEHTKQRVSTRRVHRPPHNLNAARHEAGAVIQAAPAWFPYRTTLLMRTSSMSPLMFPKVSVQTVLRV